MEADGTTRRSWGCVQDESGQSLVLFLLLIPVFFALMLLVIDGTHAFDQRRNLQNAADASALAAAYDISKGNTTSAMTTSANAYSATYNNGPPVSGQCAGNTAPTTAPTTDFGCWLWPYNSNASQVKVLLWTPCVHTFFGGAVDFFTHTSSFDCVAESASAVAGVQSGGTPPSISFAALDSTCDNHTLLIKSSGTLTVSNDIYVNSCSNSDGFDVFTKMGSATFGSISAPAIFTTGGWEVDKGTGVFNSSTNPATECNLTKGATGGGKVSVSSATANQGPGCPKTGQPIEADPFGLAPVAPTLGAAAVTGTSLPPKDYTPAVSLKNAATAGASTTAAYTPAVTLKTAANAGPTPTAYGNAVTLKGAVGTAATGNEITYNPNVTLAATVVTSATPVAYSPAVAVNGTIGTSSNAINYSSATTLQAAVGTSSTAPAYSPAVTLNAPVGTSVNGVAFNPSVTLATGLLTAPGGVPYSTPVTLNAAAASGPTPTAYSPAVTVASAISNGPTAAAYSPAVSLNTAAAGSPTPTAYAPNITLTAAVNASTTTVTVSGGGPNGPQVGDVILVDSEEMYVSAVGGGGMPALTVTRGYANTTPASHASSATVFKEAGDNTLSIKWSTGAVPVANNDVIQVGAEEMLVTNVPPGGAGCANSPCTITVARAYGGTNETTHAAAASVLKVTPDTSITVQWSSGPVPVAVNDVILIESEQMLVTAVATGPACAAAACTLTVQRAYNHTTENSHAVGKTVSEETGDTTLSIKWSTGAVPVANNDVIVIDNEQMLVTNVPPGGAGCANSPCTITVQRGYNSTNEVGHSTGSPVLKLTSDTSVTITWSGGGVPVANNQVIEVDSEQMLVTAVATGPACAPTACTLTVQRNYNSSGEAAHSAGSVVYLTTATTSVQVTNTGGTSSVAAGDVIKVGSEYMLVTAVTNGGGPWTLTVVRGFDGTSPGSATAGAAVLHAFPENIVKVSGSSPQSGDTIQVDSEQMKVTAVNTIGGNSLLTVTRPVNSTTEATHSNGTPVWDVVAPTLVQVTNTGGTSSVAVGDVIQIPNSAGGGNEQMLVTAVASGGGSNYNLTVTRAYNGTSSAAHSNAAAVSKVSLPTRIRVTNTGSSSSVTSGDTIEIDSEQMTVQSVTASGSNWDLTVTRGVNSTIAAHAANTVVYDVVPDTTIQVTNPTAATSVSMGDTIQIANVGGGNEQMLVTAVNAGAANIWNLTVTRNTSGAGEAAHALGAAVLQVVPDTVITVTNSGTTSSVSSGDTIQIDSEQMLVTGVASVTGGWNLTVQRHYNSTTEVTHAVNAPVTQVLPDTILIVAPASGMTLPVAVGDLISIGSEEMLVNAVTTRGSQWELSVTRHYSGTEAAHANGADVQVVLTPGTANDPAPDVITGTNVTLSPGTYYGGICVGPSSGATDCSNSGMTPHCAAIGGTTQTVSAYPVEEDLSLGGGTLAGDPNAPTQFNVAAKSAPGEIAVGNVILIDDEEMQVTAISGTTQTQTLTVTREFNGTEADQHADGTQVYKVTTIPSGSAYSMMVNLASNITSANPLLPVSFTISGPGTGLVAAGQVIQIDSEALTVTNVTGTTVTATRGTYGTTPTTHSSGPPANQIYLVASSFTPAASVIMQPGVYIMAGGGFHICGASSESLATIGGQKGVLIYNTNDPVTGGTSAFSPADTLAAALDGASTQFDVSSGGGAATSAIAAGMVIQVGGEDMLVSAVQADGSNTKITVTRGYAGTTATAHASGTSVVEVVGAGYGALGQVDINTSGTVDLEAQTSGTYAGMTIFQNRGLVLNTNDSCDGKSAKSSEWDIAFEDMGAVHPLSGALGDISGTIYAPYSTSDFGDAVSGVADLAVITGCIFIDGSNSTFNFSTAPGTLFGIGTGLSA